MTKLTSLLAIAVGLSGLFGCNTKTDSKTSKQDSTSIQKVNPATVLFSTATIANDLPGFKEKTDSCTLIHEDYWRQFEFISKDQKSSIDKEFANIQDVFDNFHDTMGFRKVAVRNLIAHPLSVDFSKLRSYFPVKDIKILGLELENHPGQVNNGFFFAVEGVSYYGLLDNGTVKTFCIYSADSDAEFAATVKYLSKLLMAENLYLVDWEARKSYDERTIKMELAE